MKHFAAISTVLLAVGASLLAYGLWGPWYETIPVYALLTESSDRALVIPFQVQSDLGYQIDLVFSDAANRETIRTLLGDYESQTPGELRIDWSVLRKEEVVTHGSFRDHKYHSDLPKHGKVYQTVGYFRLPKGNDYSFRVLSHARSSVDRESMPDIRVRVDGFNLFEVRQSCLIIGSGAVLLALVVSCVSLLLTRRAHDGI